MTASAQSQKHWGTLLKRLRHDFPEATHTPPPAAANLPDLLVHALLLWEASSHQAELAHTRLRATFTDHNELRVSMPDDIALALGERYPLAEERSVRMRAVLNNVFANEHAVSLERLREMSKRDARQYLLSLEGCPEYAAAYVLLIGLSGHAAPVDDRLLSLFAKAGVFAPDFGAAAACSWIEHHVHASESASIHALLRAWSDRDGHPPSREKRTPDFSTSERPAAPSRPSKAPSSRVKTPSVGGKPTAKISKTKSVKGNRKS